MLNQCLQHFCENFAPEGGRVFLETQAFQVRYQRLFEKPKKIAYFQAVFKWFFEFSY